MMATPWLAAAPLRQFCKGAWLLHYHVFFHIGIYRFLSAEGAKASPWGEAGKNL
jgi:hypothetical protein